MTALDRAFIKAFRRHEQETDVPPAPASAPISDVAAPVDAVETPTIVTAPNVAATTWRWPAVCEDLCRGAADGFEALAAELEELAAHDAPHVVAVAGSQPGVGCTSVCLSLARTLAQRGAQPLLLIDANGLRPAMIERLRLDEYEAQRPNASGVRSLEGENLGLLSLREATGSPRTLIGKFGRDFPLILIDAGCATNPLDAPMLWSAGIVDTAILIDFDEHEMRDRNSAVGYLTGHAKHFLGVIETLRADLPAAASRMTG